MSEGGIGSAVGTVGRSVRLRLRRLPEHAGRLARALAILEQGNLLQVARLAGLDELEAAAAADLLATAGILEPGRPLTFVHPIVRNGIYSELSSAERAQGHRRAAELLAEQPGASARVAQHLLVSEPAGDGWAVERLVEAARTAGKQGSPESEAVFLRRALAEPPPPADRAALLLDLGMAEASAGLADWAKHLEQAVDTAPNAEMAGVVALVLGLALSRAQRFGEAVTVLDRAATSFAVPDSDLALALEAAAVVAALNDPLTAPSVAHRCRSVLARAAAEPAAPPELLATAGFISVLTNEPAERGADLAAPGAARRRDGAARVGDPAVVRIHDVVLAGDALAALGRAVCSRCGRCSMRRSRRPGRPATAAGSPPAWRTAPGWRSGAAI